METEEISPESRNEGKVIEEWKLGQKLEIIPEVQDWEHHSHGCK